MHEVVRDLYRVFERYPRPTQWQACDHCVSADDIERLCTPPLHDLQVADLDRYAFKALSTWGNVDDFKHFLPRLLELVLVDLLSFSVPEVLLGKLAVARWSTWPEDEQRAIASYLDELWRNQLNTPGEFPHDDRMHTVLGGLSPVVDSLEPFLAAWTASDHELAALHLAQFIDQVADEIMTTGTVSLWGDQVVAAAQIVGWLKTKPVMELLHAHQDTISRTFPLVMSQLAGVQTAN